MIQLETSDGPMQAYEARPGANPRGGIVVVHDAFGIGPHVQAMCDHLAEHGYYAVAPQFFHRKGVVVTEMSIGMDKVIALRPQDDELLDDVDAAISYLSDGGIDAARLGIIGFCFGGRTSFLVAARRRLAAAVGFYGNGIAGATVKHYSVKPLIDECASMQTPWLGVFGDADQLIPVEGVERLQQRLDEECSVDHQILRYPGQDHAFVHRGAADGPLTGDARDAWERGLAWLDRFIPA